MSTYVEVSGSVALDTCATALLMSRPTWEWVVEPDGGFAVVYGSDGSLHLRFDGGSIRNIGRYIDCDLAFAQTLGLVVGQLVIDCTDGCHQRTVVDFSPAGVWAGHSECFNAPITLKPASLRPFAEAFGLDVESHAAQFFASVGHSWLLSPTSTSHPGSERSWSPPTVGLCACAGYRADDYTAPACLNG